MTRSAKNDRDSLQSRIEEWERAHPGVRWSTAAEYGTGPSAKILGYYEYEESAPLADGHEERVPLCQLLPLMIHAVLFGGGYGASAEDAARRCVG